jgi:hypothetical protein
MLMGTVTRRAASKAVNPRLSTGLLLAIGTGSILEMDG